MSKKVLIGIIVAVIVVGLVITGITLGNKKSTAITDDEKSQITTLVEEFGKKLTSVDLLSPEEMIVHSIQQNYSPYLTSNLLMKWTFDPYIAMGRFLSSPWPDRIEIDSMERLDDNTVRVKGYVIWVVSGNGALDVTDRVPAVLIVKKDPSTQKFLIDNAYSNKYAFYDTKELINMLKEVYSAINNNATPFVVKDLTIGKNMDEIAIVDMGTGGAYTEYYTICVPSGDKLVLANFKNKDGTIGPQMFSEGASAKHITKLTSDRFEVYHFYLYYYTIDRDDEGNITNITVDAYKWNTDTKMFEYDSAAAGEFKNKLQKSITPEAVSLKNLKFKEIKSTFPAIETFAVYGSRIAFSCGTEKTFVNKPSGSISHIGLYDMDTGKTSYVGEVDKPWVNIDKIQMNDKWILFKAVENEVGAPVECFAINRDTDKLTTIVPTNFEGKYVIVDDIALLNDYAYVELSVYDSEKAFNAGVIPPKKIVEVYLPNGTTSETKFDETREDTYYKITNFQASGNYLVVETMPDPNKKPPEGVKVSREISYLERTESGIVYRTLPETLVGSKHYVCTPDGYMIFENLGRITKILIEDFANGKNDLNYLPNSIGINPSFMGTIANANYIATIKEDSKNTSTVKGKNGVGYILTPSIIYVYNGGTYASKAISESFAVDAALQGNTLIFVNHLQDADTPDSIILLNLKSNGF
jgi:hypothetical protein